MRYPSRTAPRFSISSSCGARSRPRSWEIFAQANLIRAKVDEWRAAGTLYNDQYDAELAYFRRRYFANGGFTHHFPHLNLRSADYPDLVQAVLDGSNNDPRDRLLVLLMIVWRLRNNLFHGEKWAYQLQNFTHANAILMRLLERYGQLLAA